MWQEDRVYKKDKQGKIDKTVRTITWVPTNPVIIDNTIYYFPIDVCILRSNKTTFYPFPIPVYLFNS